MRLVIVTGVSGAGKSTALHALEDLGYYCADNLPMPLLPKFVELLAGRPEIGRAALGMDAREGEFLQDVAPALASVRAGGHPVEVLFLDAPDEVVLRRFSETRRRHPLSGSDIRSSLALERSRLGALRQEATTVVDTGALTTQALRGLIQERYAERAGRLAVTLLSFGFKYGLPAEADMVLDVRFLPNPFFVEALAAMSGEAEEVRRYVLEVPDAQRFLAKAEDLLTFAIRGFEREGKAYASVAVGCTGGRHRSVAIVGELGRRLGQEFGISIRHRDIDRTGS